jgi:hypothetical protein
VAKETDDISAGHKPEPRNTEEGNGAALSNTDITSVRDAILGLS